MWSPEQLTRSIFLASALRLPWLTFFNVGNTYGIRPPFGMDDSFRSFRGCGMADHLCNYGLLSQTNVQTFQLKSQYITHIRGSSIISHFLEYIFGILGVGWSSSPFDISRWDIDSFAIEGICGETSSVCWDDALMYFVQPSTWLQKSAFRFSQHICTGAASNMPHHWCACGGLNAKTDS